MQSLIGIKKVQSQRFLENGMRIPVTLVDVNGNVVVSHKTNEKDHYQAVQLGYSAKKKASRAEIGHAKKGANLEKAPKFLREVRIKDEDEVLPELGVTLNPSEVFQPGDLVNITGISKGKGFQGGMKRHGFSGGPKTHGQSDRWRAPGSIGQGTTPGRVYKGKRMAGRMGNDTVTVKNLRIVDITNDGVLVIKGLVPGIINGMIFIEKAGEDKKFVPLFRDPEVVAAEEAAAKAAQEEADRVAAEEAAKLEAEKPAEENSAQDVAPAEEVTSSTEAEEQAENQENKEEVKDGDK